MKTFMFPLSGVAVGVVGGLLPDPMWACSLNESKYLGFLLPPAAMGEVYFSGSTPPPPPIMGPPLAPMGGVPGGGAPPSDGGPDGGVEGDGAWKLEEMGGGGSGAAASGKGFPFSTHICKSALYSNAFSSPSFASVPDLFQNANLERRRPCCCSPSFSPSFGVTAFLVSFPSSSLGSCFLGLLEKTAAYSSSSLLGAACTGSWRTGVLLLLMIELPFFLGVSTAGAGPFSDPMIRLNPLVSVRENHEPEALSDLAAPVPLNLSSRVSS